MDTTMEDLHSQGRTLRDVGEVLKAAPLDPHLVAAIKIAYSLGCDRRILSVSDINHFFIETVLNNHDLRGCFSEVNTNPSCVDANADCPLLIVPYHDFHAGPHGCGLAGICKGFPVWDLICKDPTLLQTEVHPWIDGKEMEEMLLRLFGRVLGEEATLPTLDCKLESLPVAVQDDMPMPLGVKN